MSAAAPAAGPGRRRVGFFAAFYPMTSRAGGGATGLALLLSRSPNVERLVVFAPTEARPPPAADGRLELVRVWVPDDAASLWRALKRMTRESPKLDGYLFSIYVASFGKGPAVNALGLMLPVLVRGLTRKPVLVIMHNFVETQDLQALGYRQSPAALRIASFLERVVIRRTLTIVGLESQKRIVESTVGGPVTFVPMVYMDAVNSWLSAETPGGSAPAPGGPLRVLLFGSWGPQKDLDVFATLKSLFDAGAPIRVTVAGVANPNFPEYLARLEDWRRELPPEGFEFVGHVEEGKVRSLFESQDVLVLPYLASGGFSGVMNFAAMYECPVVAYEQPQLRECARTLGAAIEFVPRGDVPAMRAALERVRSPPPGTPPRRRGAGEPAWLSGAKRSAEEVLLLFDSAGRDRGPASPPATTS